MSVRRVGALLTIFALLASCGGEDADRRATRRGPASASPTTTTPPRTDESSTPSLPGTAQDSTAPLPLGTYQSLGDGGTCLPGSSRCIAFEVECPKLAKTARGEIDVRDATGRVRGVVVLFSHSAGRNWWMRGPGAEAFVDGLSEEGLTVVQVRWLNPWLASAPGEEAGTSRVACRPATVVAWVHDNIYAPLALENEPLRCGFCISGGSGGASQVSYALAFYGLDQILDVVAPVSGPPHGDLVKGCLRRTADRAYWYADPGNLRNIDAAFGVRNRGDGPCARQDANWTSRWQAEGVATGGLDYDHPETRVLFIFGGNDDTVAPPHGRSYADRLRAGGSPHVTVETVPTMRHALDDAGLALLRAALLE